MRAEEFWVQAYMTSANGICARHNAISKVNEVAAVCANLADLMLSEARRRGIIDKEPSESAGPYR